MYSRRIVMKRAKEYQMKYINNLTKKKDIANEKDQNLTKNDQLMYFSFFMQAFELVTVIVIFSYFCGIFWYLICEILLDFYDNQPLDIRSSEINSIKPYNFITDSSHDLIDKSAIVACISVFYFLMTSLTTVGLGDYHPVQ